jgi:hypothetical protein
MVQRPQRITNRQREPDIETMRLEMLSRSKTPEDGSHHRNESTFRGSLPSSEIRCADRFVTACLTATIHSQGFPPSQRFSPRTSLRLCFTPLPLIGFLAFRAFPTRTSRDALRHPLLSCHWTRALLNNLRALLHDRSTENRTQALTSEPCSSLVSDTPNDRDLPSEAAALLAFALLEAYQLVDRPETSHSFGTLLRLDVVVAHKHPSRTPCQRSLINKSGTTPERIGPASSRI